MNDDFTKYSPAILLREAAGELQPVSGTPRLDAELLLQQVLKWERHELISRQREEIPTAAAEAFRELIGRRLQHEPIAYIRGFKEFWGLCFEVGPGVLIPRPETELLVERALFYAGRFNRKISILDLGTGSGAIAVALAVELRDRKEGFHITAGDVSLDALDYAQRNIKAHGVEDRVTIRRSDWLEGFGIEERFDVVVCNPPYIGTADAEISPGLRFEPEKALFSGKDGLDDIEFLLGHVGSSLASDGVFIFEIGAMQRGSVERIFERIPGKVEFSFFRDLSGRDRVVECRWER